MGLRKKRKLITVANEEMRKRPQHLHQSQTSTTPQYSISVAPHPQQAGLSTYHVYLLVQSVKGILSEVGVEVRLRQLER